jgi:hypothetical protein
MQWNTCNKDIVEMVTEEGSWEACLHHKGRRKAVCRGGFSVELQPNLPPSLALGKAGPAARTVQLIDGLMYCLDFCIGVLLSEDGK